MAVGIIFGDPLLSWLPVDLEHSAVHLGYLGLVLLVYHGGLSTSLRPLRDNLPLSIAVAVTGIGLPIGFSFLLLGTVFGANASQCFAAGAALSATSLGTTFTILSTAGFVGTRLGVVLTSAAMMDDVIGLVMVQVVTGLGQGKTEIIGNIARAVGVSLGIVVMAVLVGWTSRCCFGRSSLPRPLQRKEAAWVLQTATLVACVTVAGYAGASVLLGAFVAGALVTWWDEHRSSYTEQRDGSTGVEMNGMALYEQYYLPVVNRILIPFFFASIGFSVPIKRMFVGSTVWKGIIYSFLMFMGKFMTGIWILLADVPFNAMKAMRHHSNLKLHIQQTGGAFSQVEPSDGNKTSLPTPPASPSASAHEGRQELNREIGEIMRIEPPVPAEEQPKTSGQALNVIADCANASASPRSIVIQEVPPNPPISVYPSFILGLAMVARGEIAFLIASIASANGIFSQNPEPDGPEATPGSPHDQTFLIVMWAAVLCTILGPLGVGLLVRRVKHLEKEKGCNSINEKRAVLGEWSVIAKS
ncbi:hypothetical protein DRE_04461 [Drechslerella stenobrocha 248]|uniref:Cation/H+ exchanger transmembrane domain-containing protein n=1 Tax=Drechslerella stenobrocha 248 TaxID=1043628 RepID=W7IB34_9PEZI|nr:hypothetical protein DRE_04461 [Drechslerella stenobrocha 248]